MSSNNETNNSKNNSNNEPDDVTPQSEFNGGSNIPPKQNDRNSEENNSGKINNWKEYGKKWIDPLVIVTVVLTVFTALLFWQASNDSQTAEKSSQAAQDAVKEQRYNDRVMRESYSIKFSSDTAYANKKFINDSIINSRNFEVSKNVLQAQINSLKQTQSDFETENRPFIIYSDIKIDTPIINNEIHIEYNTKNVGKFPAKISSAYGHINWGIDTTKRLTDDLWLKKDTKLFLANGEYFPVNVSKPNFSDYEEKVFKEGVIHVYLFLKIYYYSGVFSTKYSS